MLPLLVALTMSQAPAPAKAAEPSMVAVKAQAAATYRIAGGKGTAQLLLNTSTGSTRAALSLITFEKGAAVPEHLHDASDELLYVIEGEMETVAGAVKAKAGTGDAVLLPRGLRHSATALSKVRAVQVYTPAGPEQRFTSGEKVTK